MTILAALTRRSLEDPGVAITGANLLGIVEGQQSDAGVHVTDKTAVRFSAVYRSWSLIAGAVAGCPIHSYTRGGPGAAARIPYDAPLLAEPNPELTAFELWEQLTVGLLANGNGLAFKVRDSLGRVQELWPLAPNAVHIERGKRTDLNPSGKIFETDAGPDARRYFTGGVHGEIFHVPGLSYDGVRGLSPIEHVARQGIGLALAAERAGAQLYSKGFLSNGVLTSDEEISDPGVARAQALWRERAQGSANHWRIPVLDKGLKFQPTALNAVDAQFIESRRFQVEDIARVYGLPPWLLSAVEKSTSWGTGIEQQAIGWVKFSLAPGFIHRIEQRISKELLPTGRYAKASVDGLMRGDIKGRYEAYSKAIQWGFMTPDEPRALEDLPPLPGGAGALPWRPKNMTAVGGAGSAADQQEDA